MFELASPPFLQVPVLPGDVRVEFASTVEVPAVVRFLHPTHNLAFVQVGDGPPSCSRLQMSERAADCML